MLIEALQTHFDKPEIIFTLSDIYSDSVLYIMLLVNIMTVSYTHLDVYKRQPQVAAGRGAHVLDRRHH